MAWGIPFTNIIIGKSKQDVVQQAAPEAPAKKKKEAGDGPLPTSGGRSSEPELGNDILSFFNNEVAVVTPDFELKLLDAIEHLAKYNGDVSYALDNIVQLGGTKYDIYYDDSVSDTQAAEMNSYLAKEVKKWYKGGSQALINDLLAQIALSGVVSAEGVPTNSLDGIKRIVLVSPKNIKFVYNEEEEDYLPFQITRRLPVGVESPVTFGLRPLNPITYKYFANRRFNEKPYGIPPFLAALDSVVIEKDMINNFRTIVKKAGIFGFLQVLLRKPNPDPGESDTAYNARVTTYLNSAVDQAEKGLGKSLTVGFKGEHEFNVGTTSNNAAGAKELFDMNQQNKMSGLKQDPLMLGKNFSTSEAVGRVLLVKLGAQIANYQRCVACMLEEFNLMALKLAGYRLDSITIEFQLPVLSDEYKDQQAYNLKVTTNQLLYKQGILSQQQVANSAGYDKADQEEPRAEPIIEEPEEVKPPAKEKTKNTYELVWPEYDYGHLHGSIAEQSFDKYFYGPYKASKFTELMAEYMKKYHDGTKVLYSKAVEKASTRIGKLLLNTSSKVSAQDVVDKVLTSLYANWGRDFSAPQQKVVSKWVTAAYKAFRKDTSVFGSAKEIDGKKIPEGTFGLTDFRTLDYYKKSDSIYLGRFITDEDTKRKVTDFIKEKYIDGGLPLENSKIVTEFRKQFATLLEGEDWKIARIVNTSVTNMKDIAGINYMQQAGVMEFERVELIDNLTCGWCKNMNGRRFQVDLAVERFDDINESDPLTIKTVKPFITSVYKKPDDMAELSNAQLQAAGVEVGAMHPGCRGISIAVL